MFVKELFQSNESITVEFRNVETTFTNGIVTKTFPASATLSVQGIYWTGSSVDRLISEQHRAEVTGVVIIDPDDYTTTINEDAKCTINNQDYSVVYVDNVAGQNKIISIPLKRFKSV
jgi:hypothetical protein